jgi:hypothetical protein
MECAPARREQRELGVNDDSLLEKGRSSLEVEGHHE